jgi:hypothetical protein
VKFIRRRRPLSAQDGRDGSPTRRAGQDLALFQSLGTPCNTAIHKYMNRKKVPQLYVATGVEWAIPELPWTMGWPTTTPRV